MEVEGSKVALAAVSVAISTAVGGILALFKRVRKLEADNARQDTLLDTMLKSGDERSAMMRTLLEVQQAQAIATARIEVQIKGLSRD